MSHEESFVHTFIVPEKRLRYLELLKNPKRRRDILARLNHGLDYDASLAFEFSSGQANSASLEQLLRSKGATDTCHVIGDQLDLDGKEVGLAEALEVLSFHDFGAVVLCVPGHLAYYKPESPARGFVLEKH
jgi:hypothetical protein